MSEKKSINRPVTITTTPPAIGTGWFVLALVLITGAVFGRIVGNDFTWWDDHETIHQNPDLNPPTAAGVLHYWRQPHMGLYVPVTYTVWGGVALIAYVETPGPDRIHLIPGVFHAASVVVHIGTTLAVFALLRRLVKRDAAAFIGALVFALHPVQVEPVAWTSGMKDLLYGCFSAVALWQYVMFAQRSQEAESRRPWIAYLLASVAFALALLSKPSAVMVPVIAGILDLLIVRRPIRKVAIALAPWLVVSLVFAVVTKLVQTASHVEAPPLWARPLVALDAVAFYLYKLVLPFALAPDYGRRPAYLISSGWIYVSWIVPAAFAFVLWKNRKRAAWVIAGLLVLVAAVAPVLGLLPFEFQGYSTVADHYLYLGMLGPAMIVAWLLSRGMTPKVVAGVAVVLAVFGMMCVAQAGQWRDDEALWSHTLKVNPRSWLAAHNLGTEYSRRGRGHDAGRLYGRAVELNPRFMQARENYAGYLFSIRRDAEGIEQLRELIRLAQALPEGARPSMARQYNGIGEALLRLQKPAEAAEAFEKALGELRGGAGTEQVQRNLDHARGASSPATRPS